MTNQLRERLASGDPLYGTFATFPTPRYVEFLGLAGFDWVLLDGEHDGLGVETCYELATAARAVGMATVVRVPIGVPDVIGRYADIGVDAVIAPHVRSRTDAERLVGSLRFPPAGHRGVAGSVRAAGYGLVTTPRTYFTEPAWLPMAAALLEDVEAYDALDEIADVDGLEIACLGTGDLAGSLGVPGVPDDPRVQKLVDAAMERLIAAGIYLSAPAPTPEAARHWTERGAQLLLAPAAGMLAGAVRSYLADVRR